jgi:hypothetical protein
VTALWRCPALAPFASLAIHLPTRVRDPVFFKVQKDRGRVAHVAKLRTATEVRAMGGYLREAHAFSRRD